jgi:hypothetical protein
MNKKTNFPVTAQAALVILLILAVTLIKTLPNLNYSTWKIDEEDIVQYALGYLSGDLNPHWFGYHPLPSYILGFVYGSLYPLLKLTNSVQSGSEYASWLFSDNGFLYIAARYVFGMAYTLGCLVLAYAFQKRYQNLAVAGLLFLSLSFFTDAVSAYLGIRVDTFVFLFCALLVYFACFSDKKFLSFFLSILFCAAAIASKFPAIVFAPVLLLVILFDVYKRNYPVYYVSLYFLLLPLLVFAFTPYAFLDWEAYSHVIEKISARAAGSHFHLGKVHRLHLFEKVVAPWQTLAGQVGYVSVFSSAALAIWGLVRDQRLTLAFLFPVAYLVSFSTSATVDTYWLRPVYPFFIFFTFLFVMELVKANSDRIPGRVAITRNGELVSAKKKNIALVLLVVYGVFVIDWKSGLERYVAELSTSGSDTRVLARDFISECIPFGSTIVVDVESIPHFLPTVYSGQPHLTLMMYGLRDPYDSEMVMRGFNYFYEHYSDKRSDVRLELLRGLKNQSTIDSIPSGAYLVTSSRVSERYYHPQARQLGPDVTEMSVAFYDWAKRQTLIRSFVGKGGTIDIRLIDPDASDLSGHLVSRPSCASEN